MYERVSEGKIVGSGSQGGIFRMLGWFSGLGSEVSKGVRDDWCSPAHELYYF